MYMSYDKLTDTQNLYPASIVMPAPWILEQAINTLRMGSYNSDFTASRQLSKITTQGENHGNHGDREFVIYIHP